MNPHLVAFICCVNDEKTYERHVAHVNRLLVPSGMAVELIPVYGAESMAEGYNRAMHRTGAKYKVYLHQDTYITNANFISDMIGVFRLDGNIGMIGVAGGVNLPATGTWWEGNPQYGKVEAVFQSYVYLHLGDVEREYADVEAIDGVMMITQYDVEWDERIGGFHYYDISQSIRFRREGYRVVVPAQAAPWVFHYCLDDVDWNRYEQCRARFMQLYSWPF